ncbi:Carbonic anhydrase 7 [Trichinella patagoniensis]|uniref:Carbonic anhydrase n=1 Tax=Trichinella patagoniensis TaxID=990121 RepID=A0A0V0ZKN0_9BILA|nr:Carbonic anhydrase 7 [Trichinella patagoniensis]
MEFLNGLKQTLKIDEVTSGVASKLNTAKDFVQHQQQTLSELGAVKTVKERVGSLVPTQLQNLKLNYFSPGSWTKYFPAAKGNRQSPIDICASQAQFDEQLGDGNFQLNYFSEDCLEVRNVGTTWKIIVSPNGKSCKKIHHFRRNRIKLTLTLALSAVHLPATYILTQIHCHWGTEPMNGSEHVIGGVGYAGEIHIVHRNANYSTFEEACKHSDGIAVVAVFLNESLDDNLALEPLVQMISKIQFKNESVTFPQGFDIKCLIPGKINLDKREFWTYEGSLTTPPCCECVLWTVFRAAIPISSRQLEVFRSLYAVPVEDSERNPMRLINNIRPVQAVNSRIVRASFRAGGLCTT